LILNSIEWAHGGTLVLLFRSLDIESA